MMATIKQNPRPATGVIVSKFQILLLPVVAGFIVVVLFEEWKVESLITVAVEKPGVVLVVVVVVVVPRVVESLNVAVEKTGGVVLAVVVPRVVVVVVVVLEVVDVVVGKKVLFECVDVDVITVVAGGVVVGATAGVLTLPPSSSRSLPGTRTMYRCRSVITRNSFPGYSSFRYLALKSPKGVIASQKYCGAAV